MTERITRLVLTRRPGEAVIVGDVLIRVKKIRSGDQVRLVIEAPASVRVLREELLQRSGFYEDVPTVWP